MATLLYCRGLKCRSASSFSLLLLFRRLLVLLSLRLCFFISFLLLLLCGLLLLLSILLSGLLLSLLLFFSVLLSSFLLGLLLLLFLLCCLFFCLLLVFAILLVGTILLSKCLLNSLQLLSSNLLVELVVLFIVVGILKVLESTLPDSTKGRSRILSNGRPSGLSTKQLDAGGLGGHLVVQSSSSASNSAESTQVREGVVAEDVLGDEGAAVEDHDGLGLASATVGDNGRLREDVLLDLVASAVIDGNLDLLYDERDGRDIAELVLEIALAEEVVQVIVEAVVDLVDDEDLLNLLDDCLLTTIIDNLKVLLLDLDDLLLLVEVIKSVDEVEVAIVSVEAIDDGVEVDLALSGAGKGSRSVDGLCSCVGLVRYAICLGAEIA